MLAEQAMKLLLNACLNASRRLESTSRCKVYSYGDIELHNRKSKHFT
jgi:hypothetical protein